MKTVSLFMSLEEFLALSDIDRPFNKALTGTDWLWLYNKAKESFDKYGWNGPPVGTEITCLFAGHGGGPGVIRVFNGDYNQDNRFFELARDGWNGSKAYSLVLKKAWFREIVPGVLPFRGPGSIPWS